MSAKKLRVLYDFKAEEDGEVSVRAGDILSLIDDSNADRDGWVLVELTHSGASGFVPADYVTEVTLSQASPKNRKHDPYTPSARKMNSFASPASTAASTVYPYSVASSTRYTSPLETSLSNMNMNSNANGVTQSQLMRSSMNSFNTAPTSPLYTTNASSSNINATLSAYNTASASSPSAILAIPSSSSPAQPLVTPEEYSQLFSSHEQWFSSALAKRQEAYRMLQAETNDVLRSIRENESKAKRVAAKLQELDQFIEDERQRLLHQNNNAMSATGVGSSFGATSFRSTGVRSS
jgi:hypothetical protein